MKSQHRFSYSFYVLKTLLMVSAFSALGPSLRAQGTVFFQNVGIDVIPIMNSLTGQRAEAGTIFSFALYFAPDGVTDQSQFTQLGAAVHLVAPGYFYGGVRTAPILQPGGLGMFQVRAWETIFGTTYEDAVANPTPQNGRLALVGESGIMRVNTSDPTIPEQELPASLVGLQVAAVVGAPLSEGFVMTVVPEPSSALLLLLALPSIFFFHRRPK